MFTLFAVIEMFMEVLLKASDDKIQAEKLQNMEISHNAFGSQPIFKLGIGGFLSTFER